MNRLTGIDPLHTANMTLHELRNFFAAELPADFETRLVRRMELAFARHARWRQRVSQTDDPEYVRTFFRRWLVELLFKQRRDLFWRLPSGYRYGELLPVKSLPEQCQREPERVEIIRPVRKPVRLSCPFVHGGELLLP